MRSPAFTIKVWGVYVAALGIALLVAPEVLLGLFGIPHPEEVWVRVLGALTTIVGYYYWASSVGNATAFFIASVYGRVAFCAACIALIGVAGAPWQLLLFGFVDVLGAAWTFTALRTALQDSARGRGALTVD